MKSLLSLAICLFYLLGLGTISIAQCPREVISIENIQNLEKITYFEGKGFGDAIWSKDGEILYVITGNDNQLRSFHTKDFALPPEIIVLEENIRHLWILNTGEIVFATNQQDLDLELNQQPVRTVPASVGAIASSGDFYIRTTDDSIQVIEYSRNNIISNFDIKIDPTCEYPCFIGNIALSPDDNRITYGSYSYLIPSALINIEEETVLYDSYVSSASTIFSPIGDLIASTTVAPGYFGTGNIYLADGNNGDRVALVDTNLSSNIVFSPDSSLLVAGAIDSEYPKSNLTIWDVDQLVRHGEGNSDTAIFQHQLPFGGEGKYIGIIAFNPAGTLLITTIYSHDITNLRPEVALDPPYIIVWGIPESTNCND